MIKTYRKKNKECVLEINEHRIILSDPEIQPWNEFVYNTPEDIFHFYYNTKIQFDSNYLYFLHMTDEERDEDEKEYGKHRKRNWTFVASGYVTEFGVIQHLSKYIDKILRIDPDIEGQKHYCKQLERNDKDDYNENDFFSRYDIEVEGIFQEDTYHLTKYHKHIEDAKKQDEYYYSVYFGVSSDTRDNSVGFTAYQLTEKDMLIIKEWAEDFMRLAKEATLRKIEGWYKEVDDSNPYCPYWLKKHIEEKYPEDIERWKEIWEKLYSKNYVLEEYYKYIKGDKTKNSNAIEKYISKGKKDWEAFLDLYD